MSISISGVKIRSTVAPVGGGGGNITYDNDVNDTDLSLLLHGEGTNGSTTITDNSYVTKTLTAHGGAQISTAQQKYGGSSISFDGLTGTYVDAVQSSAFAFGTGDFTVEMWVWLNNYGSGYGGNPGYGSWIFDTRNPSAAGPGISFGMRYDDGRLLTYYNNAIQLEGTTGLTIGSWHHVAFVRKGAVLSFYRDGTLDNSGAISSNFTNDYCVLGAAHDLVADPRLHFNGYMDEIRVTKGYARYTGSFTPPVAAFPDVTYLTAVYPSPSVGDSVVSYNKIYLCTSGSPVTWLSGSNTGTV